MPTALDLFWDLAQPAKELRLDASAKLVSALQGFQQVHASTQITGVTEDASIDVLNAHDVAYALRRLARGLASPRESSRLGFAVALTELLSRLHSVSSNQMIDLVLSCSEVSGSLNGQEERDMLFARLFGLTAIAESGLLTREEPLAQTTTIASTLQDYQRVITELVSLGEIKSWLRESCWWSIGQSIAQLSNSAVSFRTQGLQWIFDQLFIQSTEWTAEKVGLWIQYHSLWGSKASVPLKQVFKGKHILAPGGLHHLAQILRDGELPDDEAKQPASGLWKPRPHFVWANILDLYFKNGADAQEKDMSPFHDFFRIVVDESIFSANSSPERKYTGFHIVELAIKQAFPANKAQVFTKNFIRTWINQLSKKDRYLHKAATRLANTVQAVVKQDPSIGFPLVVQLLGPNGSRNFDRITNTKTIELILANMSQTQLMKYAQYLRTSFESDPTQADSGSAQSDQHWAVEQALSLIRSNAVPKSDEWVVYILDFFSRYGFFGARSKKQQRQLPEAVQALCRASFTGSLAHLSHQNTVDHHDTKTSKFHGRNSLGEFWVIEAAKLLRNLARNNELRPVFDTSEEAVELRSRAWSLLKQLNEKKEKEQDVSQGVKLLIGALLVKTYDTEVDEEAKGATETLQEGINNVTSMLGIDMPPQKDRKTEETTMMLVNEHHIKPIDLILDDILGHLENSSPFMRTVSTQAFGLLCPEIGASTVDLLLAQLERRSVLPEDESEDEAFSDGDVESENDPSSSESEDVTSDDEADEGSDEEQEVDLELRQKVADAMAAVGLEDDGSTSDGSSEVLLDDDQMMELDDKLADVFRSQSMGGKNKSDAGLQREATHFKARVLDLLDIFVKRCPENPQVPRLVLPLIRVAMGSSTDETQLAEKISGILGKRLCISSVTPTQVDREVLLSNLEEIHKIARKASPQHISPGIIATSNLYLSRILVNHQRMAQVVDIHKESLQDYTQRKSSKIVPVFFSDLVKRLPSAASGFLQDFARAAGSKGCLNAFRQTQVVQWIDLLLPHLVHQANEREAILSALKVLRESSYEAIHDATGAQYTLTTSQAKLLTKMMLHAVNVTSRIDRSAVRKVWDTKKLVSLIAEVEGSENLKNMAGVIATLKQIATKLEEMPKLELNGTKQAAEKQGKGLKRKAPENGTDIKSKRAKKAKEPKTT